MPRQEPRIQAVAERIRVIRGVEARVLPESQLLVQKGMVDNPRAGGMLKAEARKPGDDGYEIYVAIREEGAPSAGPAQRMQPRQAAGPTPWDPRSMQLALTPAADSVEWTLLIRDRRDLVTVRVRSGPAAPRAEINEVLAVIQEIVLSD